MSEALVSTERSVALLLFCRRRWVVACSSPSSDHSEEVTIFSVNDVYQLENYSRYVSFVLALRVWSCLLLLRIVQLPLLLLF